MRTILLSVFFLLALHLRAQLPVSQEPRHHPVYETDKFRILDVRLPPGDTTQYHLHSTPSVFIFFTKTKTGSQLINKPQSAGTSTVGNMLYENLSPPHRRVHRVWNTDSATFHVMDIELLSKDSGFRHAPLSVPHIALVIDTGRARVYSAKIKTGQSVAIEKGSSDFILIAINDGTLLLTQNGMKSRSAVAAGNFYLIKPGDSLEVLNESPEEVQFALLEIP